MKASDGQYLLDVIQDEGFGYAFMDYSDFKNIEDEKFHELREQFLDSARELADYLGCDI